MTANISPVGNSQFIDVNGNPLSGGKLYTYEAGTTTPLAAYTTAEGDVPQPNPVILNSLGTLDDPLYLANGVAYKIIVKTSAGVSLGLEYDDIYGVAAADTTADEWLEFTGTFTYVSSTSFTVSGDQTSIFQVSRKLKTQNTAGIAYSNIASATYSAPDTTVTVTNTFLTLDSGLSQIWYGFLEPTHSSIPETTIGTAVRVGTQAEAQSALGVYSTTEVDDAIDAAVAAVPTSPSHNFRNRIVNGNFIVDQEYVAASTTFTSGAAYKRAIDMFYAWCTGANVTGQQVTVSGLKRYRFTGAASNTLVGLLHSIEAANSADLAGGDATFSVKLSSTSVTSVTWAAYYANTTDTFGTLASPTRTSIATGTFTITSTEARYSASLTGISSSATTGIEIALTTGALTAGNTLDVGEFQLEKGAIDLADIEFEKVDIALQEARCRHGWFEKLVLIVGTASSYRVQTTFARKRVTPTIGTVTFNAGSGATFSISNGSIYALTNHNIDYAAATIPLLCGLHG